MRRLQILAALALFLAACGAPTTAAIEPTATHLATLPPPPTWTLPAATAEPTALPTPTLTLDSRDQYVNAEDGLNFRAEPNLTGVLKETLPYGTHLTTVGDPTAPDVDGIVWQQVQTDAGQSGWVAALYLTGTQPDLTAFDPFAPYTIEALRARTYAAGSIEIVELLEDRDAFTRYAIAYLSDGLRVTAMMNLPKASAPEQSFPVIILNHGYVDPQRFPTGSYIRGEADYLARSGYLTLSPDYRGHAGSEGDPESAGPNVRGENTFRVDYAVDVLNLLHAVAGIPQADPARVGMWGHSMGGGITLKVLTVDRGAQVKAAVLYGAMSGDEAANLRHIDAVWQPGIFEQVTAVFGAPDDHLADYSRLSALNYVNDIAAPISIHHGALDNQVPPAWSLDLAQRLNDAGKPVEYFEYEGAGHSLSGEAWLTFMQRVTAFFDQYVKGVNG
jgi:dienelactone hydrolase